jgi:hypothetical protein
LAAVSISSNSGAKEPRLLHAEDLREQFDEIVLPLAGVVAAGGWRLAAGWWHPGGWSDPSESGLDSGGMLADQGITLPQLAVQARPAQIEPVGPAQSAQFQKATGKKGRIMQRASHLGIALHQIAHVVFALGPVRELQVNGVVRQGAGVNNLNHWEPAEEYAPVFDRDESLVSLILDMEMRRRVVIVIHPNVNAEEVRDNRHC